MDTNAGTNMGMGMDIDRSIFIDFQRGRYVYCLSMYSERPLQAEEKKETITTCLD